MDTPIIFGAAFLIYEFISFLSVPHLVDNYAKNVFLKGVATICANIH